MIRTTGRMSTHPIKPGLEEQKYNLELKKFEFLKAQEKTKNRLAVAQFIVSMVSIVAIILTLHQLRISNDQLALSRYQSVQTTYATVAKVWHDHMLFFVDHPQLRPFFFDKAEVMPNDDKQLIEAVADIRIDAADQVLTHMRTAGYSDAEIEGWRNTFKEAFMRSPIMCETVMNTASDYGLIVPIAKEACPKGP